MDMTLYLWIECNNIIITLTAVPLSLYESRVQKSSKDIMSGIIDGFLGLICFQ